MDLVSFDLDGTLVDTAAEIAEAVNRTLADFDIGRRPLPEIEALIGDGAHALMRRLVARIADEGGAAAQAADINAVLARLDEHYGQTAGTTSQAYPGCRETLDRLLKNGVRLVCVTNKEIAHARRVLEATGLVDAFEMLVGGDSLPWKKPHPAVLAHVLSELQVSAARAAHVGDSQTDVEAAHNAGVAAWAVPWGYNAGRRIADAAPARIFDALSQVADHVIALRGQPHNPGP